MTLLRTTTAARGVLLHVEGMGQGSHLHYVAEVAEGMVGRPAWLERHGFPQGYAPELLRAEIWEERSLCGRRWSQMLTEDEERSLWRTHDSSPYLMPDHFPDRRSIVCHRCFIKSNRKPQHG